MTAGSLLNQKKQITWQRRYTEAFGALWHYAFFIKIKGSQYAYDLNHDGFPEVALVPYCGGNSTMMPIVTFSVKGDRLELYKVYKKYPFEGKETLLQFLASSAAERASKKTKKRSN